MKRIAAAFASCVVLAPAAASASMPLPGSTLDIVLHPAVAELGSAATIAVSGIDAPSLQVRLVGATNSAAKPVGWRALAFRRGAWRGTLPPPELRGIYPVELRVRAGSPVLRSPHWLYRVFAPGTLTRPSFHAPEDVARWWVRTLPGNAKLVAIKPWPRPAFDRRDLALHRLLVLAYTLQGHEAVRERLGIFVTAVRDGYAGRWRLLEATALP
jgi:hypothetical protein